MEENGLRLDGARNVEGTGELEHAGREKVHGRGRGEVEDTGELEYAGREKVRELERGEFHWSCCLDGPCEGEGAEVCRVRAREGWSRAQGCDGGDRGVRGERKARRASWVSISRSDCHGPGF